MLLSLILIYCQKFNFLYLRLLACGAVVAALFVPKDALQVLKFLVPIVVVIVVIPVLVIVVIPVLVVVLLIVVMVAVVIVLVVVLVAVAVVVVAVVMVAVVAVVMIVLVVAVVVARVIAVIVAVMIVLARVRVPVVLVVMVVVGGVRIIDIAYSKKERRRYNNYDKFIIEFTARKCNLWTVAEIAQLAGRDCSNSDFCHHRRLSTSVSILL
ncbi:MAG: hypothetical protein LBJ67_13445 [Planctomycetaceae bacterium]|nr:hypothetical protein [Planctomycetaceae bacterium]